MLGQPVTKAFIQAGYDVSLLVRDRGKTGKIFGSTVRTIQGNLNDQKSIEKLLEGQELLYLTLSVDPGSSEKEFQPEREGVDNILHVAKKSGIKRIGYLSSLVHFYQGQNGYFWWAFDIKQKAVSKIKNSGIAYSIFYASTFMESFDKGAYRQGNTINLSGESKHKMYLISGTDYGKQVLIAFTLDNGNQEYVIQGPDGFTADEAARIFVTNYKKRNIKVMKFPFWILKFMGNLTNTFNYGAHIIDALNNYPEKFAAEKSWQDLGQPKIKFVDYIRNA